MGLISALDHVLIHSRDLDRDVHNYSALLGSTPVVSDGAGSPRSVAFAAGNTALLLEESAASEGLAGLCFRTGDGPRLSRRLQRLGLRLASEGAGDGAAKIYAEDPGHGVDWLEAGDARGLKLGFIARSGAATPTGGCALLGLDHAVIASAGAEGTAFLLAAKLGLDLRLDLSRPDWDARLLFFRCGDLIIEVFERLGGDDTTASGNAAERDEDHFYGLSWRTADAAATQARLAADGFNVSELRRGRKPGTQVFTVRDRSAGVATLMLEPPS